MIQTFNQKYRIDCVSTAESKNLIPLLRYVQSGPPNVSYLAEGFLPAFWRTNDQHNDGNSVCPSAHISTAELSNVD